MRPRLSFANVVSVLALFVALGGSAYAFHLGKNSVGSKQLKKNAVTTAKVKKEAITAAKVKKGTLTGAQINSSTLGTVPTSQSAQTANALAPSEAWHEVGAPGQPPLENGWKDPPSPPSHFQTAAFYKDATGVVHLRGVVFGGVPNKSIFHLPQGFRPPSQKVEDIMTKCTGCAGPVGSVFIVGPGFAPGSEGSVEPVSTGEAIWLDGITFRAES
jgi:hypothetical protein